MFRAIKIFLCIMSYVASSFAREPQYIGDIVIKPAIYQHVDFNDPDKNTPSERLVRIEKGKYQFEEVAAYSRCRSHMLYPKIIYSKSYPITNLINKTIEDFLDNARISRCTPNMKAIYNMDYVVPTNKNRYFSIIFNFILLPID